MGNIVWTMLLIIGLFISISLIFAGIGVCFTALSIIAKYILFMLSTGIGVVAGTIIVILLFAD